MSSFSFLESFVIDLWGFSFCAWFYELIAFHTLVSLGLCLLDGDFNILLKGVMTKMNSTFLHSTLFLSFQSDLSIKSFSVTLDLPNHIFTKGSIKFKICNLVWNSTSEVYSTQKRQTRSSQQTDKEWLIAFFLGRNPIHAKQKSYFVSIMVWLYYCAFHEIHLKGGASLAHSHRTA